MKILGIILSTLTIFIYLTLWTSGFFSPLEISIEEAGPLTVVYQTQQGDYTQVNYKINAVKEFLDKNNIQLIDPFVQNFSDPKKNKPNVLQSLAGFIVVPKKIKLMPPHQMKVIPTRTYATVEFAGHPVIGRLIVYPKVTRWLSQQGFTLIDGVIEIYREYMDKPQIRYLFPISSQPSRGLNK